MSEAGHCDVHHTHRDGFTDFYPWETYYGDQDLTEPCAGFGIWHINGMARYRRSIRLGLTHYMGSVARARNWLHTDDEKRLFSGKNQRDWKGAGTWLHIIFNKPLMIFGLGLGKDEVFLRWLLIERARYFQRFPNRQKEAWYAYPKTESDLGKLYFLRELGISLLPVKDYNELYSSMTWR